VYGKWKNIDLLAGERSDLVVIRHETTPPKTKLNPVRAVWATTILLAMIPLQIIIGIVVVAILPLLFPF